MDRNSTRILKRRKMELIKTPIKQNKALIGLRTIITPVAKPKAAVATPIYRVKSNKLQKKAARPRIAPPLRANDALSPVISIKGRVNQRNFLDDDPMGCESKKWRKRESNPPHLDYDSNVLPLNYSATVV
jgi:hypothetical protein